MNTWQARFSAWQDYATKVHAHATNAKRMRDERAWAMAASVGIDRNMCCVHNASLDTELRGWCAGNPHRLKVAKQCRYMLDDFKESRLADRIVQRAFDRIGAAGFTLSE